MRSRTKSHKARIILSQGEPIREREKEGKEAILYMSQWMLRAALESVSQGILGYSSNPLNSPSTILYTKAVRKLLYATFFFLIVFVLLYSYLFFHPHSFHPSILPEPLYLLY